MCLSVQRGEGVPSLWSQVPSPAYGSRSFLGEMEGDGGGGRERERGCPVSGPWSLFQLLVPGPFGEGRKGEGSEEGGRGYPKPLVPCPLPGERVGERYPNQCWYPTPWPGLGQGIPLPLPLARTRTEGIPSSPLVRTRTGVPPPHPSHWPAPGQEYPTPPPSQDQNRGYPVRLAPYSTQHGHDTQWAVRLLRSSRRTFLFRIRADVFDRNSSCAM